MCGITGILTLGRNAPPASGALAGRMAGRIRHRGPDGCATWTSPGGRCALGHARLRVIDLETGDQPMANEDGSVQVVFNGEIYNFRELRRTLEGAGHRFRTRSDTEVIVHGYEEWGEEVAKRLDGMFAFAVRDERLDRLLLVRDRAGKKPLFVYRDEDRLLFASEIGAILEADGTDARLDPAAFPLYLACGYVPAPGTFYRRIRKLPPATCLSIGAAGEEREWSYWSLDFTPRAISSRDAAERTRTLLGEAVEKRLVADVPLGAFLSGGIDSTLIVGLMAERTSEPVRTFSIGFRDDANYDETRFARMAAQRFGAVHTEFMVEAPGVEVVGELVDHYGEPFGDSSAIPTWMVSRMTKAHVTVALSGDGGDELYAGYDRFQGARLAEALPAWAVGVGRGIGRRLPHDTDFRSLPRRFSRFFESAALPEVERTLRWVGFFADRLDELLRPELRGVVSPEELLGRFGGGGISGVGGAVEGRRGPGTALSRNLALNFRSYLPEDLLVKVDRMSMAHGLEVRSPFLDTALMEHAASLPDRMKIRGRTKKFILKRAFRDLIPPGIARRPKMGFGVPLPTWFREQWRPLLEERILAPDARLSEWVEPGPILEMARAHDERRADFGHQLWALLTLEEWLRRARWE